VNRSFENLRRPGRSTEIRIPELLVRLTRASRGGHCLSVPGKPQPFTFGDDPTQAPLAGFHGARPPAPAWFEAAMAIRPERSTVIVDGVAIETLAWGEVGKPGLLFMHGNGAHADWWSFIAPFFAADWRVAAFSFSGMGGSAWRERYSSRENVAECLATIEALALDDGPQRPIIVGHSFGGLIAALTAGLHGDRLGGAVIVDPPYRSPARARAWREQVTSAPPRSFPRRTYASEAEALARFRFLPSQPSEELYIVDHIARASLRQVDGGWTWRFDPELWSKMRFDHADADLRHAGCPLAVILAENSRISTPEDIAHLLASLPEGSPRVTIPASDHHLMVDQPLAFVAALRALLAAWPRTPGPQTSD
jgi:pimeloyl-ACP methyl ester carboxylesterase